MVTGTGGVWAQDADGGWRPLAASGYADEDELHSLIEQAPGMLPLAGSPPLAMLGREVRCGREWADLVAVETDTGRPVVIEVKLAANADRRRALTQVLGYAAYLRRLDVDGFAALLRDHLAARHAGSVGEAACAVTQGATFDPEAFEAGLARSLDEGRLRCVLVLDSVPGDLVELVGYLQEVTNDHLTVDLVTVTAYDVSGRKVLVPQLVEPDRTRVTAAAAGVGRPATASETVHGGEVFAASIDSAPPESRVQLQQLYEWAARLEQDGLAQLWTSIGKRRWVLNLRVPGQERGMIALWNENGPSLSPFRSVLQLLAPRALARLDEQVPGQINQGNYLKAEYDDTLLGLFRDAYAEAAGHRN